ncbi:Tetratricopeptide repeat protein 4 [Halocaridina rubra]|uniref:Tetratricopeptide repeat protein 4 n=1 Tax=Halocaridina rubra TaxID=373956 RepID=A0AAN8X2R6_HALRR
MAEEEWREKIIKEKLGGKRDWTEEERAELCHQLGKDLDKHLDSLSKSKYKDGWTEENWKEKMAEHPIFAPYLQEKGATEGEAPMNALSEGLAQLKFDPDHSTPQEVAQNYKEEGNLQFKYKKYRLAVANFTEGLKQKCPDKDLNAQLHNNRAAAHCHLGNYRAAIKDCEKALKFKPDYLKAVFRAVDCSVKLKSWEETISWCDKGLSIDPSEQKFKSTRLSAAKEKKVIERDFRRKAQEEKKKENEEMKVIKAIMSRGITLGTSTMKASSSLSLKDLEPCHPAAQGSRVHLNENDDLVWPVMFIYPEHQETDFIQAFPESDIISDHLDVMLGPEAATAPWDIENKYLSQNLLLYFEDKEKEKLYEVDRNSTLLQVLTHPRYQVLGGTPGLLVLCKDSKFLVEFVKKYN